MQGKTYSEIISELEVSPRTIAKVAKRMREPSPSSILEMFEQGLTPIDIVRELDCDFGYLTKLHTDWVTVYENMKRLEGTDYDKIVEARKKLALEKERGRRGCTPSESEYWARVERDARDTEHHLEDIVRVIKNPRERLGYEDWIDQLREIRRHAHQKAVDIAINPLDPVETSPHLTEGLPTEELHLGSLHEGYSNPIN